MIYSDSGQTVRAGTMAISPEDLAAITRAEAPALCPELRLPGLPQSEDFEGFRGRHQALLGAAVPYWVVAWPGGQALARYLLDNPEAVRGRPVVDLGCGSGLVAAAALRAGAARALALDSDPNALSAVAVTAALNGLSLETCLGAIETCEPEAGAVICAGDLWYERETGRRATAALRRLAAAGHEVLCGDPDRPARPRQGAVPLADYAVAASEAFERARCVPCRVFALRP